MKVSEIFRGKRPATATTPSPLAVTASIPSVMIPQWHRGAEWARDAARRFYEEVEERVRLMWIDRGLWYDIHHQGLRAAGIPVYELHADNVDARSYRTSTEDELVAWIEHAGLG